jgi:hypothetical protein
LLKTTFGHTRRTVTSSVKPLVDGIVPLRRSATARGGNEGEFPASLLHRFVELREQSNSIKRVSKMLYPKIQKKKQDLNWKSGRFDLEI